MTALPPFQVLSVELGRSLKWDWLNNPPEVPAVPSGPVVVLMDVARPGRAASRRQPVGRLLETLDALAHHEGTGAWIEVHEPEGFTREYRSLLARLRAREAVPVLVYLPHRGAGGTFHFSKGELERTRVMLESIHDPRHDAVADDGDAAHPTPLDAARLRRAQLLREEHWLDAGQVHQQQGGSAGAPGANNTASRLRRKGELLGAWDGQGYRYPACQFDPRTGRVMLEMKSILATLPMDPSGWRQVFWLFQPHALLDGKRPADVLQRDSAAVLEAAQSTFAPGNSNW